MTVCGWTYRNRCPLRLLHSLRWWFTWGASSVTWNLSNLSNNQQRTLCRCGRGLLRETCSQCTEKTSHRTRKENGGACISTLRASPKKNHRGKLCTVPSLKKGCSSATSKSA